MEAGVEFLPPLPPLLIRAVLLPYKAMGVSKTLDLSGRGMEAGFAVLGQI